MMQMSELKCKEYSEYLHQLIGCIVFIICETEEDVGFFFYFFFLFIFSALK